MSYDDVWYEEGAILWYIKLPQVKLEHQACWPDMCGYAEKLLDEDEWES